MKRHGPWTAITSITARPGPCSGVVWSGCGSTSTRSSNEPKSRTTNMAFINLAANLSFPCSPLSSVRTWTQRPIQDGRKFPQVGSNKWKYSINKIIKGFYCYLNRSNSILFVYQLKFHYAVRSGEGDPSYSRDKISVTTTIPRLNMGSRSLNRLPL